MRQSRSSGDLAADRRFAYAMDYKARGDVSAAAELVEQALECAPDWAAGWFALGGLLEDGGRREAALTAFRRSLALDPSDEAGARARLARLGALAPDGAMTPTHVAALFDDYADRFEASLVGGLRYRGPALLLSALERLRKPLAFGPVLDLGCGTGLAGEAFQGLCDAIDGVDLSGAMLARARDKQVYRRLEQADALSFLEGQPSGSFDLILAADVFVYLGDLQAIFRQAARVLSGSGLFAFSAQRGAGPESFVLDHDMRYAHSHEGIANWAKAANLSVAHRDDEWARMDRGAPVPGMVVVLEKPSGTPRAGHSAPARQYR